MAKYLKIFVLLSAVVVLGAGCNQTAIQPIPPTPVPATVIPTSPVNTVAPETKQPVQSVQTPVKNETSKPTAKTVTVEISNFAFQPQVIKLKVGDTVKWTNSDNASHQVASNPHPTHTDLPGLLSGVLSNGDSYSYTFDKAGTWGYHCHIHPGMTGTVVVE